MLLELSLEAQDGYDCMDGVSAPTVHIPDNDEPTNPNVSSNKAEQHEPEMNPGQGRRKPCQPLQVRMKLVEDLYG